MSLQHAILVLLENEPGSGYDLAQRFKSGIGNFWNATHQQIYQELKKLRAEKLVDFELEAQTDRPDRKVYRITRAGHQALKRWMREPVDPPRLRQALITKVFGAHLGDHDAILAELERHRALHRKALESYLELERQYFAQDEAIRRRHRLPYLTLRCGIRYEHDWIEWLEETHELIAQDALPQAPVLKSPARRRRKAA
jgi:PadR family transcriptional regulator AphA